MPKTVKANQEYEVDLSVKRLSGKPISPCLSCMPGNKSDDIVLSTPILPNHYDKDRSKTGNVDIVLSAPILPGNYERKAKVLAILGERISSARPLHQCLAGKGIQSKQNCFASKPPQQSPSKICSKDKNTLEKSFFQSCFFTQDECDSNKCGRNATGTTMALVASDCQILEMSSTRCSEFALPLRQSVFESKSSHAEMTDSSRTRSPPKRSKNDSALLYILARVVMLMTAEDEQLVSSKHSGGFHSARSNRCQSCRNRRQGSEDPLLRRKLPRHSENSRDLNRTLFSTTTTTCMSSTSHHGHDRGDSTSTRNSRLPQRSLSNESSCTLFCCDSNSILSELTEENFMSSQLTLGSHNDI